MKHTRHELEATKQLIKNSIAQKQEGIEQENEKLLEVCKEIAKLGPRKPEVTAYDFGDRVSIEYYHCPTCNEYHDYNQYGFRSRCERCGQVFDLSGWKDKSPELKAIEILEELKKSIDSQLTDKEVEAIENGIEALFFKDNYRDGLKRLSTDIDEESYDIVCRELYWSDK